jgi:serine/threonine protein kinase
MCADIDAKWTLKWARQIADGMAYIHANQIIHGALKSKNILVRSLPHTLVLFGNAATR